MKIIPTFILFISLFASCNNKDGKKQTANQQDSVQKKTVVHRIPAELFLYHFKILDSAARTPLKDTVYHGCGNSVEFMEEYTRIEADVDGDYFGPIGFKKEDLKKWHEWFDKEYEQK
jgi:hypothetical protein